MYHSWKWKWDFKTGPEYASCVVQGLPIHPCGGWWSRVYFCWRSDSTHRAYERGFQVRFEWIEKDVQDRTEWKKKCDCSWVMIFWNRNHRRRVSRDLAKWKVYAWASTWRDRTILPRRRLHEGWVTFWWRRRGAWETLLLSSKNRDLQYSTVLRVLKWCTGSSSTVAWTTTTHTEDGHAWLIQFYNRIYTRTSSELVVYCCFVLLVSWWHITIINMSFCFRNHSCSL